MTRFYHCKKAEIPGGKGKPTIRATVSTASTGGILLSLPRNYACSSDQPVEVVFYDPLQGLTRCNCRLSAPVPSGDLCSYRCEVLETLSQEQRREDLKVTINVPITLVYNDKETPGTVLNLSAGGALITSSLSVKPGAYLFFQFGAVTPPVRLTAEVLRVELRPPKGGKLTYAYGCRFIDLKPQAESQLRGYIFQEERKLYRSV